MDLVSSLRGGRGCSWCHRGFAEGASVAPSALLLELCTSLFIQLLFTMAQLKAPLKRCYWCRDSEPAFSQKSRPFKLEISSSYSCAIENWGGIRRQRGQLVCRVSSTWLRSTHLNFFMIPSMSEEMREAFSTEWRSRTTRRDSCCYEPRRPVLGTLVSVITGLEHGHKLSRPHVTGVESDRERQDDVMSSSGWDHKLDD